MTDRDENKLIVERRKKLNEMRQQGMVFPNTFRRGQLAADLHGVYGDKDNESLESPQVHVRVAGRMMAKRVMGKASFVQLQDMSGQIQLFLQRDALPEGLYQGFKSWDVGDILGAEGTLFKTKTG